MEQASSIEGGGLLDGCLLWVLSGLHRVQLLYFFVYTVLVYGAIVGLQMFLIGDQTFTRLFTALKDLLGGTFGFATRRQRFRLAVTTYLPDAVKNGQLHLHTANLKTLYPK